MGIGSRLKAILKSRGVTIKQFSQESGISVNTLYSITKRDTDSIEDDTLTKIIETLQVDRSELLPPNINSQMDDILRMSLEAARSAAKEEVEKQFSGIGRITPNALTDTLLSMDLDNMPEEYIKELSCILKAYDKASVFDKGMVKMNLIKYCDDLYAHIDIEAFVENVRAANENALSADDTESVEE